MQVEITKTPTLSSSERCLLRLHTLLNIANILEDELRRLSRLISTPRAFLTCMQTLAELQRSLSDTQESARWLPDIPSILHNIERNIDSELKTLLSAKIRSEADSIRKNIFQIIKIFRIRTREILACGDDKPRWFFHDIALLKMSFFNLFRAIESNSQGRYRIVHNVAEQKENDYLIHLDITSTDGPQIYMPTVLHDTLRDLLLNARKYTQPGGRITTGLTNNEEYLRLVVEDTGIGIPENEITQVADFGYRASNVSSSFRQYGCGCGLTKAVTFTRNMGGRFWIDSALGKGTRICLEIPVESHFDSDPNEPRRQNLYLC